MKKIKITISMFCLLACIYVRAQNIAIGGPIPMPKLIATQS